MYVKIIWNYSLIADISCNMSIIQIDLRKNYMELFIDCRHQLQRDNFMVCVNVHGTPITDSSGIILIVFPILLIVP